MTDNFKPFFNSDILKPFINVTVSRKQAELLIEFNLNSLSQVVDKAGEKIRGISMLTPRERKQKISELIDLNNLIFDIFQNTGHLLNETEDQIIGIDETESDQ